MKKLIVLIAVAGLFSACKKDYTCECTDPSGTSKFTIKSATKRQALANCFSYKYTINNISVETNCSLK